MSFNETLFCVVWFGLVAAFVILAAPKEKPKRKSIYTRRGLSILFAASLGLSCQGQRLLRSHLLQPAESDTVCALVIRDVDAFSRAQVHTFRLTNATRLAPGDYQVAYFIDTAFVHADFMHVSHDPSVMDQFLVVGKVRVADVRFGAAVKEGNVTAIDLDQYAP